MEENLYELVALARQKQELKTIAACNEKTENFGLALTPEEAGMLIESRNYTLKKYQRVEFGNGILDKLIFVFCDSQYIDQDNYADTLVKLQEVFYLFKNEAKDELTDEELLNFMKEQFETVCTGDVDHLADTCLERFSRAIRAGYRGFQKSDGHKEYEQFDEEQRWDKDLYMQVVSELFWG